MSTHLSRKELKQDNVALKVEETTHFLVTHRELAIKVGIGALVVLAVGLTSWFFISSRHDAREQALATALATQNAPVGAVPPNGGLSFSSDAEKGVAVRKAFSSVVSQNPGSEEAYAADYYLAGIDAANGKTDDALKEFDQVISGASVDFASLAKLGKAQLLFSLSRAPEAQTILKDLMAHPTAMVSKDQAGIILARGIASTQPEEARKILVTIAASNNDVSKIAVTEQGELPAKQ